MSFSFTLLLLSCTTTLAQVYYPSAGSAWDSISPRDAGWIEEELLSTIQWIQDHEYSGPKDLRIAILEGFKNEPFHTLQGPTKERGGPAGMVIKDGKVVTHWGDTKRVDMTFSCTKSYLSTVAGLAVDRGLIQNVKNHVGDQVWERGLFDGNHNSKITWEHLLHQTSDWYGILFGTDDWSDRPPKEGDINDWARRPLVEPGTQFEYNDTRVNLLAYALMHIWRQPLPQVLKEYIMDPIGASPTWRWYGYDNTWANIDGVRMQSVSGGGHHGGGLFISTEDHARFGLLMARGGMWHDQRLLSADWIVNATKPCDVINDYGYMWWLNSKSSNRHISNAPISMYYAAGFGGNYIVVDAKNDIVIVLRWIEPSHFAEAIDRIYKARVKN